MIQINYRFSYISRCRLIQVTYNLMRYMNVEDAVYLLELIRRFSYFILALLSCTCVQPGRMLVSLLLNIEKWISLVQIIVCIHLGFGCNCNPLVPIKQHLVWQLPLHLQPMLSRGIGWQVHLLLNFWIFLLVYFFAIQKLVRCQVNGDWLTFKLLVFIALLHK